MPSSQLVLAAFVATTVFGWVASVLEFIGGNAYDLRTAKLRRARQIHPNAKRFRHRPLISVIIPAYNEERCIERCINKLFASSYKKLEVIVVDDASTDKTKYLVKNLIKDYPRRNLRLISKRRQAGKTTALADGFKRLAKGELILALDADTLVDKHALRAVAWSFAEGSIDVGIPNTQVMEHPSLIGLMQRIDFIKASQPRKLNSILNSETFLESRIAGIVYRREAFLRFIRTQKYAQSNMSAIGLAQLKAGNKSFRIRYIHNALLCTEPLTSLYGLLAQRSRWKIGSLQLITTGLEVALSKKRTELSVLNRLFTPLAVWRQIAPVAELLVVAYFIFLAIALRQPAMYFIIWGAATFIFLFNLWVNSSLPTSSRLKLSMYAPLAYHLQLVMVVLELMAVIISLGYINRIVSSKHAVWRTPRRIVARA